MAMWAREAERPDWDGLVVDIIEDDAPVGMAYEESGEVLVEFFPDADGEPRVFSATDIQVVLDTVGAMFAEGVPDASATPAEGGVDPIDYLASEFDALAAARGAEDEGFYPLSVARRIVAACEALDLAVASVEGFTVVAGELEKARNLNVTIAEVHRGEPWGLFRSSCNTQAAAVLERWITEGTIVVALEVEDASGDVYVL
ncbi:MAG TPA: hypothetical protein VLD62_08425 [Acidimicrobiia bacterium]|nr:hypothetical protein [Acidimicrobiia bacterium]